MSMDRQHGRIVIVCDGCPDTEESGRGEDFQTFWDGLKEKGWRAEKVEMKGKKPEWVHMCPSCES